MTTRILSTITTVLLLTVASQAAPVTFQVDVRIPTSFGHFEPGPDVVELRGTMNGWTAGEDVLSDAGGDLVYSATVDLPATTHEY